MSRFALVLTENSKPRRWQIHGAKCDEIIKMVKRGAFAQFLSSESALALIQVETSVYRDGRTRGDYQIMACCGEHSR